jgi:hypothetical protein
MDAMISRGTIGGSTDFVSASVQSHHQLGANKSFAQGNVTYGTPMHTNDYGL